MSVIFYLNLKFYKNPNRRYYFTYSLYLKIVISNIFKCFWIFLICVWISVYLLRISATIDVKSFSQAYLSVAFPLLLLLLLLLEVVFNYSIFKDDHINKIEGPSAYFLTCIYTPLLQVLTKIKLLKNDNKQIIILKIIF